MSGGGLCQAVQAVHEPTDAETPGAGPSRPSRLCSGTEHGHIEPIPTRLIHIYNIWKHLVQAHPAHPDCVQGQTARPHD